MRVCRADREYHESEVGGNLKCCFINSDGISCDRKAIFHIQHATGGYENNTQACERHYDQMRESLDDTMHPIDQETGEVHERPVSETAFTEEISS